jgi:hypothetical protein
MTSEQAAHAMPDNTLDFCFIDADHRHEAVKQNTAWPCHFARCR